MRIVTSVSDVRAAVLAARQKGFTIAFVPTMGALHAGHASLMHAAHGERRFVVASIFVNPLQFNDASDLAAYPRTDDEDESLCASCGVDLVWRPEIAAVYPPGFDTSVAPGAIAANLEGLHRPGHFTGMATVVLKLLNVVSPDVAYFGRKDYQQLAVVRRMVRDLDMPVHVVGCPTVREADGLAMSSRNVKLSSHGRAIAANLSRVIGEIAHLLRSGTQVREAREHGLDDISTCEGINLEYLEVVDRDSFMPVEGNDTTNAVVLVAATVEGVRLIDNVEVHDSDVIGEREGDKK